MLFYINLLQFLLNLNTHLKQTYIVTWNHQRRFTIFWNLLSSCICNALRVQFAFLLMFFVCSKWRLFSWNLWKHYGDHWVCALEHLFAYFSSFVTLRCWSQWHKSVPNTDCYKNRFFPISKRSNVIILTYCNRNLWFDTIFTYLMCLLYQVSCLCGISIRISKTNRRKLVSLGFQMFYDLLTTFGGYQFNGIESFFMCCDVYRAWFEEQNQDAALVKWFTCMWKCYNSFT